MRETDYHDFTHKDMPVEERRRLNVGDVWLNRIECTKCHDIVQSNNRHDMRYCQCGRVFVDGGSWYTRCGGDITCIRDISEPYTHCDKEHTYEHRD